MNEKEIEEAAERALIYGSGYLKVQAVDPYHEPSWWERWKHVVVGMLVSFGSGFIGFIIGRLTA